MESAAKLVEKITFINFDVGSSCWVDITHINNPDSFYVRPTAYRTYLSKVNAYGDEIEASDAKFNTLVIFNSKLHGDYVRGQIFNTSVSEEEVVCEIFAIDYGYLEKSVLLKNIYTLKHSQIPPLATYCQLADCKPVEETWTDKAVEALKYYVGNERAKMIIRGKTPEQLIVELINTCPDDIATMLALTGYTTLGHEENVINRLTVPIHERHYFTYKEINVDDVLHVRVQSGNTLKSFCVAEVNDYKRYLIERNNFTYFLKQQNELSAEDLKENKSVGVFMDSTCKYERGIIKQITVPESKAKVLLVDWGNIIEVHISNMKAMSEKFFFYPVMAIHCSADDSQVWDNALHKFLYPGYEFFIKINELGDEFECPNIVTIIPACPKK